MIDAVRSASRQGCAVKVAYPEPRSVKIQGSWDRRGGGHERAGPTAGQVTQVRRELDSAALKNLQVTKEQFRSLSDIC